MISDNRLLLGCIVIDSLFSVYKAKRSRVKRMPVHQITLYLLRKRSKCIFSP